MLCVGNSHMACVLAAATRAGVHIEPLVLKETKYFDAIDRELEYVEPEQLESRLSKAKIDGPIYSFVGGGRHLATAYRRGPRPYDVYLPAAPDLPIDPEAEIIPVNALRQSLSNYMSEPHLVAIKTLIDIAPGPVFHFASPPPPDLQWFATKERNGKQGWPYLRYKLWLLGSDIIRDFVQSNGGTYIENPPSSRDEAGFLRAEYVANSTHANEAYGELVLEQMESLS